MSTRPARARLRRGRQPHWNAIGARTHLGYQRWDDGERAGRWILRRRIAGRYSTISIGAADDTIEADGLSVLSYHEARERALGRGASPRHNRMLFQKLLEVGRIAVACEMMQIRADETRDGCHIRLAKSGG